MTAPERRSVGLVAVVNSLASLLLPAVRVDGLLHKLLDAVLQHGALHLHGRPLHARALLLQHLSRRARTIPDAVMTRRDEGDEP